MLDKLEKCIRHHKTAARMRPAEPNWRMPSSPVVGEKHVVSLCKLKSVLMYRRVIVVVVGGSLSRRSRSSVGRSKEEGDEGGERAAKTKV